MKRILALSALATFVLWSACTSSVQITSSWTSPQASMRSYDKILVIGIMGDTMRYLRQSMENALVQSLSYRGVKAVSAFEEYGPKAFSKMTEQQVNEQIKNKGFDGVITISLLNKKKEKYYVPGQVYYTPYYSAYGYPFFWGYYSLMYDRVYEPAYYGVDVLYFWESNLFDLHSGKLVYSVQSNSFNSYDAQALSQDYANTITRDLVQHGIVSRKALL